MKNLKFQISNFKWPLAIGYCLSAIATFAGTNAAVTFNTNTYVVSPANIWPSNAMAISNALAGIGFTGGGTNASGATTNLPGQRLPGDWYFSVDAAANYHAIKGDYSVSYASNDFSGLANFIFALPGGSVYAGESIHLASSWVNGTNAPVPFTVTNTIFITNSVVLTGEGNPSTQVTLAPGATGPVFQLGTAAQSIGGIAKMQGIRFVGVNSNDTGVLSCNAAEPAFENCEFHNFGHAGIEITNYGGAANEPVWSYIRNCFFVNYGTNTNSCCLLLDAVPDIYGDCECHVSQTLFGVGAGGTCVILTNGFVNFTMDNCRLINAAYTAIPAVQIYNASGIQIENNHFKIYPNGAGSLGMVNFAPQPSLLNADALIANNESISASNSISTNFVSIGSNVTGVAQFGNACKGHVPFAGDGGGLTNIPDSALTIPPVTNNETGVTLGGNIAASTASNALTSLTANSATNASFATNAGYASNAGLSRMNTIWVETNGSDSGLGTNILSPFLTLSNAVNVASNLVVSTLGDVAIHVGSGTFPVSNLVVTANISIIGAGANQTYLPDLSTYSAQSGLIIEGNNITLRGFTLGTNIAAGLYHFPMKFLYGSNFLASDLAIVGDSDGIYVPGLSPQGYQNATVFNCTITTAFDDFTMQNITASANSVWTFQNCVLNVVPDGSYLGSLHHAFNVNVGNSNAPCNLTVQHCTLNVSNNTPGTLATGVYAAGANVLVDDNTYNITNGGAGGQEPIDLQAGANGGSVLTVAGAINPAYIFNTGSTVNYDSAQFQNVAANSFTGNGGGMTNLQATNIIDGPWGYSAFATAYFTNYYTNTTGSNAIVQWTFGSVNNGAVNYEGVYIFDTNAVNSSYSKRTNYFATYIQTAGQLWTIHFPLPKNASFAITNLDGGKSTNAYNYIVCMPL